MAIIFEPFNGQEPGVEVTIEFIQMADQRK
jgi:hypothetical protein